MRKKVFTFRDCHSQKPLHIPNRTTSLRKILDRASQGLPINTQMAQHEPLPPDGMDLEDFDSGTEEYLDLVDVQHLDERVKAHHEKAEEEKRKKVEEKKRKDFEDAVAAEVAKRAAESQE